VATVAAAVILRMLIYCDILYAMPNINLWEYYTHELVIHFFSKYCVSFLTFVLVFGFAMYRQLRGLSRNSIST
jgi:hypothetical protein